MVDYLPIIVFAAVIVVWIGFFAVFVFNRKPAGTAAPAPDRKRAPGSIVGIVLQGFSYGLVWGVPRPFFTLPFHFSALGAYIWAAATIALAAGSVGITVAAVRTLGKEWSLTARVVEGHRLVRSGPYALVRHPIYTGMLGMLLVTGSAVGRWQMVGVALADFLLGTIIRVRAEERLLHEEFGAEFEAYARRVRAIIPFIL